MKNDSYLKWMAENTETDWCNDSAMPADIKSALAKGAVGCTTNPPLTYQVLSEAAYLYSTEMSQLPSTIAGDPLVVELIGIVVRRISTMLMPIFTSTGGQRGFVRAQVAPPLSADPDAMLSMGKTFSSWAPNIKVKIPGTAAGIWVLEELTALGIATNPTICVSVSQMIAAAEAHERGLARAAEKGVDPPHSTSAFVLGRLQDYLAVVNGQRKAGLSTYDLECAVLAAAKKCYQVFVERGYRQMIMPAAFRCARQVTELAGSKTVMTIHPSVQTMVENADQAGEVTRESMIANPVDADAVDRVLNALPEFRSAFAEDGISIDGFDSFGATVMTLNGFNETGWQKLLTYEIPT